MPRLLVAMFLMAAALGGTACKESPTPDRKRGAVESPPTSSPDSKPGTTFEDNSPSPKSTDIKPSAEVYDDFYFCYLRTGPLSDSLSDKARKNAGSGHFSNMKRMAGAGDLLLAGPYDEGRPNLEDRGIFIFDTPKLEKAQTLAASDPGVLAGMFKFELVPVQCLRALRKVNDWHVAGTKKSGGGRGYVRPYVLLEFIWSRSSSSHEVLGRGFSGFSKLWDDDKVLLAGRFGDKYPGKFFVVLDATTIAAAKEMMTASKANESIIRPVYFPWYATKALTLIPGQLKAK
ncbi:MAG: hypothetical protein V3W41_10420 [Planctomycetota bacterium]